MSAMRNIISVLLVSIGLAASPAFSAPLSAETADSILANKKRQNAPPTPPPSATRAEPVYIPIPKKPGSGWFPRPPPVDPLDKAGVYERPGKTKPDSVPAAPADSLDKAGVYERPGTGPSDFLKNSK